MYSKKLAEKSLHQHPNLKRVILVKRPFRCDVHDSSAIKYKLSEYGNRVFEDLWLDKGCPSNIIIAQQHLECEGQMINQRFGTLMSNIYDGVHYIGKLGIQHFTRSFLNVLLDSLPNFSTPS